MAPLCEILNTPLLVPLPTKYGGTKSLAKGDRLCPRHCRENAAAGEIPYMIVDYTVGLVEKTLSHCGCIISPTVPMPPPK